MKIHSRRSFISQMVLTGAATAVLPVLSENVMAATGSKRLKAQNGMVSG
jgi:hypothetical protein